MLHRTYGVNSHEILLDQKHGREEHRCLLLHQAHVHFRDLVELGACFVRVFFKLLAM